MKDHTDLIIAFAILLTSAVIGASIVQFVNATCAEGIHDHPHTSPAVAQEINPELQQNIENTVALSDTYLIWSEIGGQ